MKKRSSMCMHQLTSMILVITIIMSKNVFAEPMSKPPHMSLLDARYNIENLKDTERYNDFLKKDSNYIETIDNSILLKEIAYLDQYQYNAKKSFAEGPKDTIIYSPNAVGNVVVAEAAREIGEI